MTAPGTLPNTILCNLSDGTCRTMDELDDALSLTRRQISNGAAKLVMRGFVERIEVGCYQLTEAGRKAIADGVEITSGPYRPDYGQARRPQRQTLRQRAWNTMRISSSFSISDLIVAAASGSERNAENNLQLYCRKLASAGYLAELPVRQAGTRLTSNGFKRYRLLKDTGNIAPVWRPKKRELFDHNLGPDGEVVSCA